MAHRSFCDGYCQSIGGRRIDQAVAEMFLETLSPASLNIHLQALQQLQQKEDTVLKQLALQVENRMTLSPEPSPPLPPDERFSRIRRSRALPLTGEPETASDITFHPFHLAESPSILTCLWKEPSRSSIRPNSQQ
jgi:hypothetical protein